MTEQTACIDEAGSKFEKNTNKFEILISCTGLADLDEFTKSDPMCVLFVKHFGQWKEIGRTEAIRNTLNPKFVETFILDFIPTLQQSLMFSVYDIDCRSMDLRHHDLVGNVEVTFADILDPEKPMLTCCKTLRIPGSSRGRGIISITTERVNECTDKVSLHVGAHKLHKLGKLIASKPDVFFEISRCIDNVSFHPVYRTETILKTQDPRWRPLQLDLQRLCNGNWDRQLELSVWHHSGCGDYKMVGRKVTTLRDLKNIQIVDCEYSLLDYTRGGMKLNLLTAIDFTSSNGKLGDPMSLHDITDDQNNPYITAMASLCGLVCQYCTDQRIGLMGFGAKTENSSTTSHCFPLTNNWNRLYVHGVQNAIGLYKDTVRQILLSGPTKLKPIISMAESMSIREPSQPNQVYNILLVMTDGIINDMDDVIERLISIVHLPLSVIFIGVGPADFSLMECFNHHSVSMLSLKELNIYATRRHTHFLAFPHWNGQTIDTTTVAQETFGVISAQIIEYMRHREIVPNRPKRPDFVPKDSIKRSIGDHESMSSKRSPSRTSLISLVNQRSAGPTGPKCPTCGSVLHHGVIAP